MSFVLRILFSGLIAFVPSPDGKELTVLLLDPGHEYSLSDGTPLAHHYPLVVARAGACEGQCGTGDGSVATYFFPGTSEEQAAEALAVAVQKGTVWKLTRSDLSLGAEGAEAALGPPLTLLKNVRRTVEGRPAEVPANAAERKDFSWIADLRQLLASAGGGLRSDLVKGQPPRLIAARLTLRSGNVFTYRLVRVEDHVGPIQFLPLQGGREASYRQALAGWVAAEIEVRGATVKLMEKNFDTEAERSMTLSPHEGKVELAVLNLPELRAEGASELTASDLPQPGTHFELFYALAGTPPEKPVRLVPQAMTRSTAPGQAVSWEALHPQDDTRSSLLETLNLEPGRGPYNAIICPMAQYSDGG